MLITIIGSGSLLSRASAEKTCPTLTNFRLAKLTGYKRVFNKTDPLRVFNGTLPTLSKAYACLSLVPDNTIKGMIVSAFEIQRDDWNALLEREFEYKLIEVPFNNLNGIPGKGIACVGDYVNDSECEEYCKDDPIRMQRWQKFKQLYKGPMWRTDLLPNEDYLARCLSYCKQHGEEIYTNFIHTTFVGDGTVSIADYLNSTSTTTGR